MCICKFYPYYIFKQVRGITISNNASPWLANLGLVNYELVNKIHLDYLWFSRYIDNMHILIKHNGDDERKRMDEVKLDLEIKYLNKNLNLILET